MKYLVLMLLCLSCSKPDLYKGEIQNEEIPVKDSKIAIVTSKGDTILVTKVQVIQTSNKVRIEGFLE